MTVLFSLRGSAAVLLVGWLLSGCSEGPAASSSEAPAVAQEVGVIELQPAPQAVIRELPGRIAPTRIAEVRARVSGIVVNRNFEQGSDVKIGDVLYELDARPFEIEVEVAEAALRKATAVLNQERKTQGAWRCLQPSVRPLNPNWMWRSRALARPKRTSQRERPTSPGPSSISNTPGFARRLVGASVAHTSPRVPWSVNLSRRTWRRSSGSIQSMRTSPNRLRS